MTLWHCFYHVGRPRFFLAGNGRGAPGSVSISAKESQVFFRSFELTYSIPMKYNSCIMKQKLSVSSDFFWLLTFATQAPVCPMSVQHSRGVRMYVSKNDRPVQPV